MTSPGSRLPLTVRVTEARYESDGVRSLVLRRTRGSNLPAWAPGAHIDLILPDGATRQYSLCSNPTDLSCYRIAVLLEPDSRGGSRWVHGELAVGDVVQIRSPRNHFALEEASGYTFVAGGIGITPILPMVERVAGSGRSWRLVYGGRSRAAMAFLANVVALGADVEILAEDEVGRPNLHRLVDEIAEDHLLYVCGPSGLIEALKEAAAAAGCSERIRYELFSAPVVDDGDAGFGPPFEVELRRSGLTIKVPSTSSILREVRAAGVNVITDCEDGICGSCETTILAGEAEHRDHVLTPEEQRANTSMMICVSRCRGDRLVLDL